MIKKWIYIMLPILAIVIVWGFLWFMVNRSQEVPPVPPPGEIITDEDILKKPPTQTPAPPVRTPGNTTVNDLFVKSPDTKPATDDEIKAKLERLYKK